MTITQTVTQSLPRQQEGFAKILAWLKNKLAARAECRVNRDAFEYMLTCPDYALDDIGTTRRSVMDALSELNQQSAHAIAATAFGIKRSTTQTWRDECWHVQ